MYEGEVQDISYSFDGCTLAISPTDIDLIGSNSCKNRANNRTGISEEAMGPGHSEHTWKYRSAHTTVRVSLTRGKHVGVHCGLITLDMLTFS